MLMSEENNNDNEKSIEFWWHPVIMTLLQRICTNTSTNIWGREIHGRREQMKGKFKLIYLGRRLWFKKKSQARKGLGIME